MPASFHAYGMPTDKCARLVAFVGQHIISIRIGGAIRWRTAACLGLKSNSRPAKGAPSSVTRPLTGATSTPLPLHPDCSTARSMSPASRADVVSRCVCVKFTGDMDDSTETRCLTGRAHFIVPNSKSLVGADGLVISHALESVDA